MARIRTVKPEFWCDEKLSPLSAIDRLVFLGLISMADDYGRVHDNVKIIDAFVFPNTSDTVRESLANLSRIVRIKRGISSSGMPIIEIVNWDKHQRVDKPQPKLALPPIMEEQQEKPVKPRKKRIPESFANESRTGSELVAPLTTDPDPDLRPPTNEREHEQNSSRSLFSEDFEKEWDRWKRHRIEKQKPLGAIEEESQLMDLMLLSEADAIEIVRFSLKRGAINLIDNGDHKNKPRENGHRYGKQPINLDEFVIK